MPNLRSARLVLLFILAFSLAPPAFATSIDTTETGNYLLVGRIDMSVAKAVEVGSSNTLGRILSPVPSESDPDVSEVVVPMNGMSPVPGITNDGNVAITNPLGSYSFSDIDIYADIGIRCEQNVLIEPQCRASGGFSNSNLSGGGTFDNDPTGMATIETEMDMAAMELMNPPLTPTDTWSLSLTGEGSMNGLGQWVLTDGVVNQDTTITLVSGLNVIEIVTSGNDFELDTAGLVIDGPADAQAIFVLADNTRNFKFTTASVTKGNGGIGPDAILFAMVDGGNDTNFGFSKVILNGVSFWDLDKEGMAGEISMDNVQGCTQLVGDKLGLMDVQLSRCAFGGVVVPEPSPAPLLGLCLLAWLGAGVLRHRRTAA